MKEAWTKETLTAGTQSRTRRMAVNAAHFQLPPSESSATWNASLSSFVIATVAPPTSRHCRDCSHKPMVHTSQLPAGASIRCDQWAAVRIVA